MNKSDEKLSYAELEQVAGGAAVCHVKADKPSTMSEIYQAWADRGAALANMSKSYGT